MKKIILFMFLMLAVSTSKAQFLCNYKLKGGALFQKTERLYWENGIGADFTSDFLMNKKVHFQVHYVTSRLGSAIGSNAIKQDNFVVGANWHFLHKMPINIVAGLNTGYFYADYEEAEFDVLPHTSMLLQAEAGLEYSFILPVTVSLSAGYNLITGNGESGPGTLFPVYYQLKVYYNIK